MARSAVVAASVLLLILAAPARGQAPAPLVVEAEQIVYDQPSQVVEAQGQVRLRYRGVRLTADRVRFDLGQERLTAEGRVVLVDAEGRELRGRRIRYDVRLQLAEVEQAQAIVDTVYVRSEQLRAQPDRVVAEQAMVTTCDPASPAYRITASRVEVVPGEELVARDATIWLGRRRLATLPVYRLSLRSSEETARSFGRAGYNLVDGFWVDYPYTSRLGPLEGLLYAKLATRTGFIPRAVLTYRHPAGAVSLTVGRNQNDQMLLYEQAEGAVDVPLGSFGIGLRSGWFREPSTGVETSRSAYEVRLAAPPFAAGPSTLRADATYRDAYYGAGGRYIVTRADAALERPLGEGSTVALRYARYTAEGVTPFLFETVDPDDLVNTLALAYVRSVPRGDGVTASFTAFTSYSFLDGTPSVGAGVGRRRPNAYHVNLGGEYNLVTRAFTATTDSGLALGAGTYLTVQAAYLVQPAQFDYLDVFVTARLCGCFEMRLKYRTVQREFWLEVALAPGAPVAFPQEVPAP